MIPAQINATLDRLTQVMTAKPTLLNQPAVTTSGCTSPRCSCCGGKR